MRAVHPIALSERIPITSLAVLLRKRAESLVGGFDSTFCKALAVRFFTGRYSNPGAKCIRSEYAAYRMHMETKPSKFADSGKIAVGL